MGFYIYGFIYGGQELMVGLEDECPLNFRLNLEMGGDRL